MWVAEHSVETSATPEAVWRQWADVAGWPEWNGDIERIDLDGPFAAGSRITMTPAGQDPVALRIADVVEPTLFVDEAELGEIVVRTTHRAEPLADGRTRITYRMEITGPGGETLGPEISGDFPEVLAALAERAQREAYKRELDEITIGGAQPLTSPIEIREYDPEWPALYAREEDRIRSILGRRVVRIEHAGSTSVPGLPAKPVVDIVLEVPDSADEAAYAADLEAAGYPLRIREPDWYEHRLFKGPETNVNLHVFSAGCEEVDRMLRFRDHLRDSAADRDHYATVKRELAAQQWTYVQQYADAKTEVVREILARASGGNST